MSVTPGEVAAGYDQIADRWVDVSDYGFAHVDRAATFVRNRGEGLDVGRFPRAQDFARCNFRQSRESRTPGTMVRPGPSSPAGRRGSCRHPTRLPYSKAVRAVELRGDENSLAVTTPMRQTLPPEELAIRSDRSRTREVSAAVVNRAACPSHCPAVGDPMVPEKNVVSIRAADVGDAAVLADLARRTFHDTFAAHNRPEDMDAYMGEAFTAERIATDIRRPGVVWLLAESPPEAVGFATLAPEPPPACVTAPSPVRLAKLYVAADALGSGVGAALMRSCIERAKAAGYGGVWLGVWEHNHRAKAFYERWGFVPVGVETFRLGGDDQTDVVMQLVLSGETG